MSIAQRTVKGIVWVYTSFLSGRLLSLISTAVLARLLVPEDFGVIGFALVFMAFLEAARSLGINDALIFHTEDVDEAANTTFIINSALGVVQCLIAIALAPLLTLFFEDPRIVDVVRVLSLNFILEGLGQTHDALMQKELQFRDRFWPDLLANVVKTAVAIVLAFMGFGVWSLVFSTLTGTAARLVSRWFVLGWWPKLRFSIERARQLWSYGIHILAFEMLNIAIDQADQLLIGVLLGQLQLGYYAIAMRIPEIAIANFSMVLTRVLFPAYAKMKDDIEQLTRSFLATTRYTAFVTVPVGVGLACVAPELVPVVFGPQWGPSVPLLQILALMGTMATLPWSAGDVLKALGRPEVSTRLLLIESLYTFPLIILLVSSTHLAIMAAVANLIALTITAILRLGVITRYIPVGLADFWRAFRSPFAAGALMALGVYLWRTLLMSAAPLIVLITSIVLGALVYAGLLWLFEREALLDARDLAVDMIQRRRNRSEAGGHA